MTTTPTQATPGPQDHDDLTAQRELEAYEAAEREEQERAEAYAGPDDSQEDGQ